MVVEGEDPDRIGSQCSLIDERLSLVEHTDVLVCRIVHEFGEDGCAD